MARKLPSHLKIHTEDHSNKADRTSSAFEFNAMLDAFAEVTGWRPMPLGGTPHHRTAERHDPEAPRPPLRQRMQMVSTAPLDGMLDVEGLEDLSLTSEESAWKLMEQLDALIGQLEQAESTIERQEAQLATALGVSIRHDESEVLASRLRESLHRAAELTSSDAAALYLLDETTSELKMRSCWGLPTSALSKPPRQLRGSLADLEALMGNAVLVENTELAPEWGCPENFAAALCIPIGSPTMPHGTLWLWSEHVRDFSQHDIDAGKAAGDKILVDIERSVLADEVLRSRGLDRQIESASLVQSSRLPSTQPLHIDYEIGGWTFQGQSLGGNFHTWTLNKYSHICAALGSAATRGAAGALVATSVQTVVETCWNAKHRPAQIMRKANDMLWEAEDGDWRSALCYLTIHPESGSTQLALAGDIQAFVIGERGFRMLSGTSTLLAAQPDTRFENQQLYLEGGDLLMLASAAVVGGLQRGGFDQQQLLELVREMQDEAVEDIVDQLRRKLPMVQVGAPVDFDRSLLLLRRRF
ncbi:MAG: SpoIIE family protein phosphatase [Pirellulaceae bacterium]